MQHFYENIQGWTKFGELYQRVVSEAPHGALFAEVGCWLGRSAAISPGIRGLCAAGPSIRRAWSAGATPGGTVGVIAR